MVISYLLMVAFKEAEVKKTFEQLGNYTNLPNYHAQSSTVRIVGASIFFNYL